jgi:glutathione synthase/RimK-type ligase-like ATP-grasp enzyme
MLSAFRKSHSKLRYIAKPLANKWSMHQVLMKHVEIAGHLPDTKRYAGPAALSKLLSRHRFVYLKPKNGTGGRGIIRVERLAGDAFALQGRNASRDILPARTVGADALGSSMRSWGANDRYIMQQGIPPLLTDGRVCDFRLLIQKNGSGAWEVTGCAGRIGPSSSITSNLHGGGQAISMNALLRKRFDSKTIQSVQSSMNELSLVVAQHLESHYGRLCELGIDLAVDPDGRVWLLEVNPKPSREVFRRIGEMKTYRKAIVRPLEYAKWLLERKSAPHAAADTEKPAQL